MIQTPFACIFVAWIWETLAHSLDLSIPEDLITRQLLRNTCMQSFVTEERFWEEMGVLFMTIGKECQDDEVNVWLTTERKLERWRQE